MELPKRLTQDESEFRVIELLMARFATEATVLAYIVDVHLYGEKHNVPAWPSLWDGTIEDAVLIDFEEWCFGTAWEASL